MTTIPTAAEYIKAVNEAKYHDHLYFALNAPIISDEEYDALYFAIQDYEAARPSEVLPDSPTQHCYGENGNGKRTAARRTPCLSMKKLRDSKSMLAYLRTQAKAAGANDAKIDTEWKFDGETVSLVYCHGALTEATYGHGKELMGIDCADRIKLVQGVPANVDAWATTDRVEVRGEVIISFDNFARYRGSKKSPRMMSNGIMSTKHPRAFDCSLLEFRPFRVIADGQASHSLAMMDLALHGFNDCGHIATIDLASPDDDLLDTIDEIVTNAEAQRDSLPYPTDGLVFKFDDYTLYDAIGYTAHDAKHNVAYKFQPVYTAITTYRGHHMTTGTKTGKTTYIAEFDEVTMNGHTFTQASCGTERTFAAKNIHPGDIIAVSLHGDVIVCVDGVVRSKEYDGQPAPTEDEVPAPAPEPTPSDDETPTPEPTPWPAPSEDETDENEAPRRGTVKKVATYAVAGLAATAACVALFAVVGAAIFFLPLLGGAFVAKG